MNGFLIGIGLALTILGLFLLFFILLYASIVLIDKLEKKGV